jgi:hypothetical protein
LVVGARLLAGGCPAASNFLLLRQKKVSKEKATLLSATPLRWRCEGQPAVLGPAGVELELAALRQSLALIRLALRSSAHTEGWGKKADPKYHGESQKPPDDPEQSKRFEDKARELGVDESGKLFNKAMRIMKPLPASKNPPPRTPGGGKSAA